MKDKEQKVKRQIRTTKDKDGNTIWLGCTVSFEERAWRVRDIIRSGRVCSVVLEEALSDPHSTVTTYAGTVHVL